jgi:hypothetical protein
VNTIPTVSGNPKDVITQMKNGVWMIDEAVFSFTKLMESMKELEAEIKKLQEETGN